MKLSLNWLREYVALDASVEELTRAITFLGFEVEGVVTTAAPVLESVVVGEVLTRDKHPNADKLSVCTVDVGPAGGIKTIVCGATNYSVGDRVPVALPGAVLPGDFKIKQSTIRGQLSDGMMCSARELGMGDDHGGLLILAGRPALGAPIASALPPGDTVFDIEITPNRPDCLSHLGLARELAAWFRRPLSYPQEHFRGNPGDALRPDLLAEVRVDAPEDCPLYTAHIITGVKVGPSPAWLQDRLKAVGLRPINNIVDVGNFVLLESGQPLHTFDARKIAGGRLIIRHAGDGEKIVTLDGKERVLNSRMLVIADAAKPLVVAGIMGGQNSGVDESTIDVVVEGAIFRPQSVRWTSRKLGLSSDSSYRYERGVDPHMALEAAYRAIDLIIETAGGVPVGPVYRVGGEAPWQREIVVEPGFIRARLGFEIPDEAMRASLEGLELKVVREEEVTADRLVRWTVSIPSWRGDLDRPIDLVEEVLRLYGTDRIGPGTVVAPALVAEDDPVALFNRKATGYLVGHDFHECVNLTLRPGPEIMMWVSQAAAAELALSNPFVADQSHLRPNLINGLLETLRLNQSRGVPLDRLAETGRIFVENNGAAYELAASGFVVPEDRTRRWKGREAFDIYAARHHVAELAAAAGVDLSIEPVFPISGPVYGWQEGQSAGSGGPDSPWIARFGLLNLALVRSLGIEGKVYAGIFAIRPENLPARSPRIRYLEPPAFPAALRDLALVVEGNVPAEAVRKQVESLGRSAAGAAFGLEAAEIFDLYEGRGLPEGRKGLAFSLVFRSASRTLTDEEVNAALLRLQEAIARSTPYQLRK